jgi:hypothetical protein
MKLTPEPNVIKPYLSVIYESLYPARVLVRLGWKGLQGKNTLVYYKNPKITDIKKFITLIPGLQCYKTFYVRNLQLLILS